VRERVGADSPQGLLEAAYHGLGYDGTLFDTTSSFQTLGVSDWTEKGEWLSLAKKVGAEKLFFVDNNPVIVFAQSGPNEERLRFQEIWNMARPALLFLASPGDLAVYDLTQGPAQTSESWEQGLAKRRLDRARTIGEVAERLSRYRREQVESGKLFGDISFEEDQRADKALIADLRLVRRALMKHRRLKPKYAHSLIGRSIFIRYLEDRKMLVPEYFEKVARGNRTWQKLLDTRLPGIFADSRLSNRLYLRVLQSKSFTYALFRQLSQDFNGDVFPEDATEEKVVTQEHLNRLRRFLCGTGDPTQPQLFFFAYNFDIIPIELISSIYEEFYAAENVKSEDRGSHYTPPALVEFILSQVLTPEALERSPRILDPACGSGIFLVETFRRIVRYQTHLKSRPLTRNELLDLLRENIAGIDINEEAIRVAAFSLYLAFLNYQEPPDILAQIKAGRLLPNLTYDVGRTATCGNHFDILLATNAFDIASAISPADSHVLERFSQKCADIVVGNPPWGSPGQKKEEKESRMAMNVALRWCEKQTPACAVGDREWSQAFIHRVLSSLKDGGKAGLLVSSGVLFKSHLNSQFFRRQWLSSSTLERVVNFSHVRGVFFKGRTRKSGAQSPFVSVVFRKGISDQSSCSFEYWSAKKTAIVNQTQAVVLGRADMHRLDQNEVLLNDTLWKTYWWGGHRDRALIDALRTEACLKDLVIDGHSLCDDDFGRGFEEKGDKSARKLRKYKYLPTKFFKRYGSINQRDLRPPPKRIRRTGNIDLYDGIRLLVKRGITEKGEKGEEKGVVVARLATEAFCFRHSIYGLRLPPRSEQTGKVLLGILWSSLVRYYYWLTAGSWVWHNQIDQEDLESLPVRMPAAKEQRDYITRIVDRLRAASPGGGLFPGQLDDSAKKRLEGELDEAVFELYELNPAERDQVTEMCKYGLDLFYRDIDSDALKTLDAHRPERNIGVMDDVPSSQNAQAGLEPYLRAFLEAWNRELEPSGEFRWEVIRPKYHIPMLGLIFTTQEKGTPLPEVDGQEMDRWQEMLSCLDSSLTTPLGSRQVYIDGLVRAVSDSDILIIKRNERRLWTRTAAREDVEATLLQAIHLQEARKGG
jgi:hypothetical protein